MYKAKDLLKYWRAYVKVNGVSRKAERLAVRNYIIAILYYKYGFIEDELGKIFKIHRCSINWSKPQPYYHLLHNDVKFKHHTKEISELFPYTFPEPKGHSPVVKKKNTIYVNKSTYEKLTNYSKRNDISIHQAADKILSKL